MQHMVAAGPLSPRLGAATAATDTAPTVASPFILSMNSCEPNAPMLETTAPPAGIASASWAWSNTSPVSHCTCEDQWPSRSVSLSACTHAGMPERE